MTAQRISELEKQLAFIADSVLHWPEHPWIPGSEFLPERSSGAILRAIISEHRTRPSSDGALEVWE